MNNIFNKNWKNIFVNMFIKISVYFVDKHINGIKNFLTGMLFVALNYITHISYNMLSWYIIPGTILIVNGVTLTGAILIVIIVTYLIISKNLYDSKKDMYSNMIPGAILFFIGFLF